MIKPLNQLSIITQTRLIIWLALLAVSATIVSGCYLFVVYEKFRYKVIEAELPMLKQISQMNLELNAIEQQLLDVINLVGQGKITKQEVDRHGKNLIDRVDNLQTLFDQGYTKNSYATSESPALHISLAGYRRSLQSAIEMSQVSLDKAHDLMHKASVDALVINRYAAVLEQTINEYVNEETRQLNRSLLHIGLPLIVLLLILLVVSFRLLCRSGANVAQTFAKIQASMARLRTGNTEAPIAGISGCREAEDLMYSLEEMRRSLIALAALRTDLESQVEDRTRRLASTNQQLSRQIDQIRLAQKQLNLYKRIFESTAEGIYITDADGLVLEVNDAYCNITGYPRAEVIGKQLRLMQPDYHDDRFYEAMVQEIRDTGEWTGEIWEKRYNGGVYPQLLTVNTVFDEQRQPINYVGVFTDISKIKSTEQQLEKMAFYDRLTGLANRRLLFDRMEHAVTIAQRSGRFGAILYLDLDRFKYVNDTLGHDIGDKLLVEVALRLKNSLRRSDTIGRPNGTVGRLAGDEFLIIIENLPPDETEAAAWARIVGEKIVDKLAAPYHLEGKLVQTSSSVGITLFNGKDLGQIEKLLMNADAAMYQAKKNGRNSLHFFDPEMQAGIQQRIALEKRLRATVEREYFSLLLQPQVDRNNNIVAAEALIRWNEPDQLAVSPADFIPLAEEINLIQDIGRWVIKETCRLLKSWEQDPLLSKIMISINISAKQFINKNFVDEVWTALQQHNVTAERLKLEITEGVVISNLEESIARMRQLQAYGIKLSMDDFGTGYSSLSYLRQLPFDQIKIDRSFIKSILTEPSDLSIVQSVIKLGELMNVEVVAEGVENTAQHEVLFEAGCHLFQGYLFAKPLSISECEAFIRQGPVVDSKIKTTLKIAAG